MLLTKEEQVSDDGAYAARITPTTTVHGRATAWAPEEARRRGAALASLLGLSGTISPDTDRSAIARPQNLPSAYLVRFAALTAMSVRMIGSGR